MSDDLTPGGQDEPQAAAPQGSVTADQKRDDRVADAAPLLTQPASLKAALSIVLTFVLAGILVGLHTISAATLPHILAPTPGISYQEVTDGLPVPRLLDWNLTQIETMIDLKDTSAILIVLQILAAVSVWAVSVRALNPTFRLFSISLPDRSGSSSGVAGAVSRSVSLEASIRTHGLMKTLSILLFSGIPIALVWFLTLSAVSRTSSASTAPLLHPAWLLRLISVGMALWIGFHTDGIVGPRDTEGFHVDRGVLPGLALRGALWGLSVYLVALCILPGGLEPLLTRMQALGTFDIATWTGICQRYMICTCLAWFAAGCLMLLFSSSASPRSSQSG